MDMIIMPSIGSIIDMNNPDIIIHVPIDFAPRRSKARHKSIVLSIIVNIKVSLATKARLT